MIDRIQITTHAAGSAGAASGYSHAPHCYGRVLKVAIAYSNAPGTTDVTLEDENDPGEEKIVNLVNNVTDRVLYPRRPVQDNANADLTYDGTRKVSEPYLVHGRLRLTVDEANANTVVTAIVWLLV